MNSINSFMDLTEFLNLDYEEEEKSIEVEFPVLEVNGIILRLMNKHHSLWGELIWPCSKIISNYFLSKDSKFNIENKTIIEFGSGSGLCSISAAKSGAKKVICTDYPDDSIINNLKFNTKDYNNIEVIGHRWGDNVEILIEKNFNDKFDIAILCDLVFNHSEHKKLLKSLKSILKSNGFAIVAFSHHRVHLINKDLEFIELAQKKFNFKILNYFIEKHPPMFKDDPGDINIRSTSHIYILSY